MKSYVIHPVKWCLLTCRGSLNRCSTFLSAQSLTESLHCTWVQAVIIFYYDKKLVVVWEMVLSCWCSQMPSVFTIILWEHEYAAGYHHLTSTGEHQCSSTRILTLHYYWGLCDIAVMLGAARRDCLCCYREVLLGTSAAPHGLLFHYREFLDVPGTEQQIMPWSPKVFFLPSEKSFNKFLPCIWNESIQRVVRMFPPWPHSHHHTETECHLWK